jgi:hypothetical protein
MLVARLKRSDALKSSVLVDDQIDMCDWRCRSKLWDAGNKARKPKPNRTIVERIRQQSSRTTDALAKTSIGGVTKRVRCCGAGVFGVARRKKQTHAIPMHRSETFPVTVQ